MPSWPSPSRWGWSARPGRRSSPRRCQAASSSPCTSRSRRSGKSAASLSVPKYPLHIYQIIKRILNPERQPHTMAFDLVFYVLQYLTFEALAITAVAFLFAFVIWEAPRFFKILDDDVTKGLYPGYGKAVDIAALLVGFA